MGFQILDKEGKAIPINLLDKEVCELWGDEIDPKYYCKPYTQEEILQQVKEDPKNKDKNEEQLKCLARWRYVSQSNWYDQIGWVIHQYKFTTWEQIYEYFKSYWKDFLEEHPQLTFEECDPKKVELINYWKEKGYTPKPVEN